MFHLQFLISIFHSPHRILVKGKSIFVPVLLTEHDAMKAYQAVGGGAGRVEYDTLKSLQEICG